MRKLLIVIGLFLIPMMLFSFVDTLYQGTIEYKGSFKIIGDSAGVGDSCSAGDGDTFYINNVELWAANWLRFQTWGVDSHKVHYRSGLVEVDLTNDSINELDSISVRWTLIDSVRTDSVIDEDLTFSPASYGQFRIIVFKQGSDFLHWRLGIFK